MGRRQNLFIRIAKEIVLFQIQYTAPNNLPHLLHVSLCGYMMILDVQQRLMSSFFIPYGM